jgi:hypothetical protein
MMFIASFMSLFVVFGCVPGALLFILLRIVPPAVPTPVWVMPVSLWLLYVCFWSWGTARLMLLKNQTLEDAGKTAERKFVPPLWQTPPG